MWLIPVEVIAKPDGSSASEIGFMNVTTWAVSEKAARLKIEEYLNSFGWHLVQVENDEVITEDFHCVEEVGDMIGRTSGNPDAIIFGNVSYVLDKLRFGLSV